LKIIKPEQVKSFKCLLCDKIEVENIIVFPETPLANSLASHKDKQNKQKFYPLNLGLCKACGHVQLTYRVPPSILFKDYPYLSNSNNETASRFSKLAEEINQYFPNKGKKFALEIGSNDGYLLSQLKLSNWQVLGVDPSENAANLANSNGITTITSFFSKNVARKIHKNFGKPDVIIANNVLAHTNKMRDIFSGIELLMGDNTLFIMEFSYVLDVYEKLLFDTIYHEHMSYHSINSLSKFLSNFSLQIVDVTRFNAHGGSARIYVKKYKNNLISNQEVTDLQQIEKSVGLATKKTWLQFEDRLSQLKQSINNELYKAFTDGKAIIGFGVPAKFTTLFHVLGLNENYFKYIVDDNLLKHGKLAPGTNLEIYPVEKLISEKADFVFIFSWNYQDEISKRIWSNNLANCGVIIPLPELSVIYKNSYNLGS
jgi:hypothetical protein